MLAAPLHELADLHVGRLVRVVSPIEESLSWSGANPEGCIHDDETLETPWLLVWECEAEEASPVLHHERDVGEVEGRDEVQECFPVVVECVPGLVGGFVGAAEADEIWTDDPAAGSGCECCVGEKGGYHAAVEIGPGGLAVQTEEELGCGAYGSGTLVDVSHSKGAIIEVMRGVWEVREI